MPERCAVEPVCSRDNTAKVIDRAEGREVTQEFPREMAEAFAAGLNHAASSPQVPNG